MTDTPKPTLSNEERAETVTQYLARMRAKDLEKCAADPSAGLRTTREIAEFYGVSTSQMKKDLERLFEADLVDACQVRPGLPVFWSALSVTEGEK